MINDTEPTSRFARVTAVLGLTLVICACAAPSERVTYVNCVPRATSEVQCVVPPVRKFGPLTIGEPAVQAVVDARCLWNHTGVELEKGAVYSINARSREEDQWADDSIKSDLSSGWRGPVWSFVGRLFQSGARAPELPMYSLVAAQGGGSGIYSVTGRESRLQSRVNGAELLFFANDWPRKYGNNHGCVDIEVRRVE